MTSVVIEEVKSGDWGIAAALAALFTEDAVLVTPEGLFSGRQAIEKRYAGMYNPNSSL